jgi:PST family polysaccharide transporter
MVEAISIWLTGYVDIFIIGIYLNEYYLGIYKTSMATVGQITSLITAATTPILFSSLSRLQSDREAFLEMFFKFQKLVGMLVIPLGVGIYCFRDLVTDILLGSQWSEAANFIGLWGLTSAITIVLSHYSSEVYRSLGRPKLSVLAQVLHIAALCPAMLIAVKYDWEVIYTVRALVRLELVLVNLVIMYFTIRLSAISMLRNILPSIVASGAMGVIGVIMLSINGSMWYSLLAVVVCIVIYFAIIASFNNERQELIRFAYNLKQRK